MPQHEPSKPRRHEPSKSRQHEPSTRRPADPGELVDDVLDLQAGVISYRQAVGYGYRRHDIRRLLRRRVWAPILPRVYVCHTGAPSWEQRAWAALVWAEPAALTHISAIRAVEGPRAPGPDRAPIHLLVEHTRRLDAPAGVVLHRSRDFGNRLDPWSAPPRVRLEHAVIDTWATEPDRWERVELIARACRNRHTSSDRIRVALEQRERVPDRAWFLRLLGDVAGGSCSVLEQGYLESVERAHGLPRAVRQSSVRATLGMTRRDVTSHDLVIELDGRLYHDTAAQRDRDLDRDLDAWVRNEKAVRLGYGQVFRRPCQTARRLVALLRRAGWTGRPHRCGPTCAM